MSLPLLKRSQFLDDYAGIIRDIQEADALAAHLFCDAVEAALTLLSAHPEIARKVRFPRSPEARIWPVRGYSNYLIIYRVTPTHVVLLRLLHGARDLPPLVPPA